MTKEGIENIMPEAFTLFLSFVFALSSLISFMKNEDVVGQIEILIASVYLCTAWLLQRVKEAIR